MADSTSSPNNTSNSPNHARQFGLLTVLGTGLVAFLLGWFVMGWWLAPVKWSEVYPNDLRGQVRDEYVEMAADSYALTADTQRAAVRLQYWQPHELAQLFDQRAGALESNGEAAGAERLRLLDDVLRLPPPGAEPEVEIKDASRFNWQIIPLALAILVLLAVAAVLARQVAALWQDHRDRQEHAGADDDAAGDNKEDVEVEDDDDWYDDEEYDGDEPETAAPSPDFSQTYPPRQMPPPETRLPDEEIMGGDSNADEARKVVGEPPRDKSAGGGQPLGPSERITFTGETDFDEVRTIETAEEYQGEYGVSVSDVVSGDAGKALALEVWLFDKSGIRTITATLLHPNDYNNESIRRRFAGENGIVMPLERDRLIRLNTESLAVEGVVKRVEFGASTNEGTPIEFADFEFVGGVAA